MAKRPSRTAAFRKLGSAAFAAQESTERVMKRKEKRPALRKLGRAPRLIDSL